MKRILIFRKDIKLKKTISNIFFNGIYQVFAILLPIITVPYVSRILGSYYLGEFSYFNSICIFLSIFVFWGLNQFGTKLISENSGYERTKIFFQLWSIQITIGLVIFFLFLIISLLSDQRKILILFLPYMASLLLDLSWFYIGISEIKKVILRNTFVKIVSIFLIFLLVKSERDFSTYILVNTSGNLLANLFFIFSLKEFIDINQRKFFSFPFEYFKTGLGLLVPQIAVQVYTSLDKVVIGTIAGSVQLSYYDQSQKIVRILLALVGSVSLILMPEMARQKNVKDTFMKIFNTSLDMTLVISMLLAIIVSINTKLFIPWFFGSEFSPMTFNMMLSSLLIIFISYGGVFANQYALSMGLYRIYSLPYIIGAIMNIILNLLLVSKWSSLGGTISLIATELIVCLLRVFLLRNEINIFDIFRRQFVIFISGVVTLCISIFNYVEIGNTFFTMCINSLMASIIFGGLIIFISKSYRNKFFNIIKLLFSKKDTQ